MDKITITEESKNLVLFIYDQCVKTLKDFRNNSDIFIKIPEEHAPYIDILENKDAIVRYLSPVEFDDGRSYYLKDFNIEISSEATLELNFYRMQTIHYTEQNHLGWDQPGVLMFRVYDSFKSDITIKVYTEYYIKLFEIQEWYKSLIPDDNIKKISEINSEIDKIKEEEADTLEAEGTEDYNTVMDEINGLLNEIKELENVSEIILKDEKLIVIESKLYDSLLKIVSDIKDDDISKLPLYFNKYIIGSLNILDKYYTEEECVYFNFRSSSLEDIENIKKEVSEIQEELDALESDIKLQSDSLNIQMLSHYDCIFEILSESAGSDSRRYKLLLKELEDYKELPYLDKIMNKDKHKKLIKDKEELAKKLELETRSITKTVDDIKNKVEESGKDAKILYKLLDKKSQIIAELSKKKTELVNTEKTTYYFTPDRSAVTLEEWIRANDKASKLKSLQENRDINFCAHLAQLIAYSYRKDGCEFHIKDSNGTNIINPELDKIANIFLDLPYEYAMKCLNFFLSARIE